MHHKLGTKARGVHFFVLVSRGQPDINICLGVGLSQFELKYVYLYQCQSFATSSTSTEGQPIAKTVEDEYVQAATP